MKKIILLLAILTSLAFSTIDEYKIDVYYGNGILAREGDAEDNARLLETTIKQKFGLDYYHNHIGKVDYAYNETNGAVLDAWETLAQKLNFQYFIDLIFDTSHGRDLRKQVTAYKNSIKDGHNVLVVAHSQGNLFAAEALGELDDWMKDRFHAISVASPKLFKIKADTPHVAFKNDVVPYLGGVFVPIDNPNGEAGSIESHAFTYYMGLPSEKSHLTTNVANMVKI